jgi:hypothetical protein
MKEDWLVSDAVGSCAFALGSSIKRVSPIPAALFEVATSIVDGSGKKLDSMSINFLRISFSSKKVWFSARSRSPSSLERNKLLSS